MDLPYSAVVNKFDVRVDGNALGLANAGLKIDGAAPVTALSNPSAGAVLSAGPAQQFSGSSTDAGGARGLWLR